ncbi:MAG TPA: hypothetical protein DDW42_02065 [Desulfobacteraceae bacterium]|nr:hypothetical protein [Desulfobacteraceae bacterium]
MKKSKLNFLFSGIILIAVVCFALVLVSGCATAPKKTAKGPMATLEVCPTAKVTTLEYFMKKSKFSGGPKLHVKVGVTNSSDKDKRYRVSIFLPDGVSSGGFFPRKGKPPVIKPGQEKLRTFPMYFDGVPDTFTVRVEEL